MDIRLRVTPEVPQVKAVEVEGDIKELEKDFNSIQDIVARTSGYWTGMAAESARKMFGDLKDDTATVIKRFKDHPRNLLTMAGIYQAAETTNTELGNELPSDVIV